MDNIKDELIDRYIYDVVRRLDKNQRDDIEKELRSLVDDMLKERSNNPDGNDIKEVLTSLGKPSVLADSYRDKKKYLIGPEYYDKFIMISKIVASAVLFATVLAYVIDFIVHPSGDFTDVFSTFIGSIITAVLQSVGFVALIFIIIERKGKDIKFEQQKWSVEDLPQIPKDSIKIKRADPIVGIIFSMVFLVIINTSISFFSIYITTDHLNVIPIFNESVFKSYLLLFNIMIVLGIIKDISKFLAGKYTMMISLMILIIDIITMIIIISVFANSNIWNASFIDSLRGLNEISIPADVDNYFNMFKKLVVLIFVIPLIVDIVRVGILGVKQLIKK